MPDTNNPFEQVLKLAREDRVPIVWGSDGAEYIPPDPKSKFADFLNNAKKQIVNAPEVFGQYLNNTRENLSKTTSALGDTFMPWRHNVPDKFLTALESPDFEEVLRERQYSGFTGNLPGIGGLTAEQTNWLLDPRRTKLGAPSAFGVVAIPTGQDKIFKYQHNPDTGAQAKYDMEASMTARTAELGLGPKIYQSILRNSDDPNGIPITQSVFVNENIPHTRANNFSPLEMQYRNLEAAKLTEDLYRNGIANADNHANNVVIDKRTGKPMQLDSGLAREYNPASIYDMQSRLRNITNGLAFATNPDLAKDTSEMGNGLIQEIIKQRPPGAFLDKKPPDPSTLSSYERDLLAETERFFQSSGDLLKQQKIDLPFFNKLKPPTPVEIVGEGLKQPSIRSALTVGAADLIPTREVVQDLYRGDIKNAALHQGQAFVGGIPFAAGAGIGIQLAPAALATPLGIGLGVYGVGSAVNNALDEVAIQQTGKGLPHNEALREIGTWLGGGYNQQPRPRVTGNGGIREDARGVVTGPNGRPLGRFAADDSRFIPYTTGTSLRPKVSSSSRPVARVSTQPDIGTRAGHAVNNEAKYIWRQVLKGKIPYFN